VLHNLVGNASRHCNQGEMIVVAAQRWNDDDSVELAMTNSGPRIADDSRPQRFVPTCAASAASAGMGLYFGGWWPEPWWKDRSVACFLVRLPGRV
jgi:K+-sensing histidine kinase KdpD